MSVPQAIKAGINSALIDTMVAMPGIIQLFDPLTQTVKVDLAIMRIINGENQKYTVLIDIPIMLPSVQGFHLTMPIKKGDECLVVFADRCIDNWFIEGGVQPQLKHRIHHISDGFAIIGVNSTPNLITEYDPDNMVLRNTKNDQKITLKATGDIDIDTSANINVNCVAATVNATEAVNITTPTATLEGNLVVTGKIDAAQDITSATKVTAPTVIGSTNVIMGGISGIAHVHGGVQPGLGNTAGPQ